MIECRGRQGYRKLAIAATWSVPYPAWYATQKTLAIISLCSNPFDYFVVFWRKLNVLGLFELECYSP